MFLQSQKCGVYLKISVKNKIEIELVKTAFLDPSVKATIWHTKRQQQQQHRKAKSLKYI